MIKLNKKILATILLTTSLFSYANAKTYTNCKFKDDLNKTACLKMVKKGVSYQFANEILLSEKSKKRDEVTLRLFKPKMLTHHKKQEKKANNVLIKKVGIVLEHIKEYKEVYDYVETKYKVNREIIASILLKETHIGKIKLKHDAFVALNSLYRELEEDSPRNKRLKKMGLNNIVYIAQYCDKNKITVKNCNFPSSYAGATGIPQFMPMNFYLVKGYKNSKGDLNKMEDAIVSTANYLNKRAKFKKLINLAKFNILRYEENKWYEYQSKNYKATFNKKSEKCYTCNKKEFDYINTYVNKIKKYNYSDNYAIGVLSIAYTAYSLR